jgi:hypothetical protein
VGAWQSEHIYVCVQVRMVCVCVCVRACKREAGAYVIHKRGKAPKREAWLFPFQVRIRRKIGFLKVYDFEMTLKRDFTTDKQLSLLAIDCFL